MNKVAALMALAALPALASCGGEEQKAKAKAAAQALQAGQWQSRLEVTRFERADEGRPKLDLPVGTRIEAGGCVQASETSRPSPNLFVGDEFEDCEWGSEFYMRGGRLVSSLICQRAGVGEVPMTVDLNFTGESYEGSVEMRTRLVSDGDVVVRTRAQGNRTGAQCTSGEAGGNSQSQSK